MSALSARAAAILDLMEPEQGYDAAEVRAFAPDLTPDALREVMHELWIARHVERYKGAGWRRVRMVRPRQPDVASLRVGRVKPEDLFDHDSFADVFK